MRTRPQQLAGRTPPQESYKPGNYTVRQTHHPLSSQMKCGLNSSLRKWNSGQGRKHSGSLWIGFPLKAGKKEKPKKQKQVLKSTVLVIQLSPSQVMKLSKWSWRNSSFNVSWPISPKKKQPRNQRGQNMLSVVFGEHFFWKSTIFLWPNVALCFKGRESPVFSILAVNNISTTEPTAEQMEFAVFTQELSTLICVAPRNQSAWSRAMSFQSETYDLRKQRESCQDVPVACGRQQGFQVG